jgi:hypothetical protein
MTTSRARAKTQLNSQQGFTYAITTKLEPLQVENYKNECDVLTFTVGGGGIYRGEWDLHRHGEVGLAPGGGWLTKPRDRLTGWSGLHRLRLLLLVLMCGNQGLGRTTSNPSQPAPGPTRPGVGPTWSTCQIHPYGNNNFDIW